MNRGPTDYELCADSMESTTYAVLIQIFRIFPPFSTQIGKQIGKQSASAVRREHLDFMISLNERHLRRLLTEWVIHYNKGRPHSSLGPGMPHPSVALPVASPSRHQIPHDHRVVTKPVLGGLHHEYGIAKAAA